MIGVKGLAVSYPGQSRPAIADIELTVPAGTTCAVVGPSGGGKSTLLKVLAGIITDYEGEATLDGAKIDPKWQTLGYMPQNYGLLPWKTAAENIRLRSEVKGRRVDEAEMTAWLEKLGLTGLADRYPAELSGGQQQRVALVGVFILRPQLLLLDEPFSALDAISREEMAAVFLRLWQASSPTAVIVTHQVEEAVRLGRRIVLLADKPGRIKNVFDNPFFAASEAGDQSARQEFCRQLRDAIRGNGA